MEKLTGLLLLLLAVINFAVAQETLKYFKTGGNLTLDLRPRPAEPITNVLWKFKGNLVAEWMDKEGLLDYFGSFNGRTVLDIKTGRLVINKMTEADQGVYTVEVNNKVQSVSYKAISIEDVNKPEVEPKPLSCSPASKSCTMSCETNTSRTGPLTYSWKMDDGEWKEAEQKLPINKTEHACLKTFTCRVKNPLGVLTESDPKKNPLAKDTATYFQTGGELTLDFVRPPSAEPITNILWKFNGDPLAEWVDEVVPLSYYGTFHDRTVLDIKTGRLEINKMTKADTGVYTVEVNNKEQSECYEVGVIREVPQPVVSQLGCYSTSDSCAYTCNGNTDEAEPVTYSWWTGDGAWTEWRQQNVLYVLHNESTQSAESVFCRMKNPVSEKESKSRVNPFLLIKILMVVILPLTLLAAVVYWVWRIN